MKILRILVVLILLAVVAAGGAWLWANRHPEIAAIEPPDPNSFDRTLVEKGAMLADLGACAVCHTAPGGQEYAGGLALPTPFGTIYSTNITADPETGIGRWSEEAFRRAMHEGLDREGRHLYPAFPYDHFAKVSDEDVGAIYAYLMSEPGVAKTPPENELPFPFSVRALMEGWKFLFLDRSPFVADASKDEEWNRGAYLVQGLGHCGACHTPRNMFGAVDGSKPFGGSEAEGWFVPAIGAASTSPVPWTMDSWENYLFDGWDEFHGIAGGPMTPVIDHFRDVEEDDVFAMAVYMASLTPEPAEADVTAKAEAIAKLDWAPDERPGGANKPEGEALLRGEQLFAGECARCHQTRISEQQPASLGVTVPVNAPDPRNIAATILKGVRPPQGSVQRQMPAFDKLPDEDIASIIDFVRWRFTDLPAWENVGQAITDKRAGH
jgi:mono/diheme cytochrome c family protein